MAWRTVASTPVSKSWSTSGVRFRVELNWSSSTNNITAYIKYNYEDVEGYHNVTSISETLSSSGTYRAYFSGSYGSDSISLTTPSVSSKPSTVYSSNTSYYSKAQTLSGTLYIQEYVPEPPSTPTSITVPSTIKGGESITVSWGSSSGATSYRLERSVDGGTWTQIYSGGSRSYTDTITKGWNTVAYRVRAYNSDGYSSYRTSPTRTVINFPEMQIKINGVLKTSENGWVKINGVLREIDSIYVKVNGQLKEVQ